MSGVCGGLRTEKVRKISTRMWIFPILFSLALAFGRGRARRNPPFSSHRSFTSFYFQSRFIWRLKRVFKEVNLWRKNDTMAVFIWFCYSRSGAVKLHSTHPKDFHFCAMCNFKTFIAHYKTIKPIKQFVESWFQLKAIICFFQPFSNLFSYTTQLFIHNFFKHFQINF